MPRKKKTTDFEQSLQELESIVTQMEQGDLSLEDSLKAFEEGVSLTRECQNILAQAEQKVQLLIESGGELKTEPFEPEEDS
ncbi:MULTISPECIES: exodeoxyribonuclease VII small subunit [unclassified Neptuniibacter]|jgi:exodeoxyribonuclease VII small subunit|uniref:exodeoxyribonuclease VII small subunit n=1 Tax=unclassified Neptuniibacter TaxID=2630693 RepID=UPI0026E16DF7|nr:MULTISPECIES: exodeoxyribonuclease VII small subunit [unclassified Neptuniibacter]MDO6513810.1 exodeoxyribonuclease VII small subunit [Neptuniibacter sp. 2_MG-2023]MDO6593230.1 exodeoxyribonuclease VII small subunit [Neptuniibacter sp. 1_MG-2023]